VETIRERGVRSSASARRATRAGTEEEDAGERETMFSRSAPERGEDLARYFPDDLFDDAPTIERVTGVVRPSTPVTTARRVDESLSHLTVVKECASPSLHRFIPDFSSPAMTLDRRCDAAVVPPHLSEVVKDPARYALSPSRVSERGGFSGDESSMSPTPPVAVYSYASSAGSSGGRSGSFAGRPPRGDKRLFKPGSSLPKHSGSSFGNRYAPPANKVNPAIGFTGAGFRAARDEYLDKVMAFFHVQHNPDDWVPIKGKGVSVNSLCRKPVTMPETLLEFFSSHGDKFQINDERTMVRLRAGLGSSDSEGTNVDSLSEGIEEKLTL